MACRGFRLTKRMSSVTLVSKIKVHLKNFYDIWRSGLLVPALATLFCTAANGQAVIPRTELENSLQGDTLPAKKLLPSIMTINRRTIRLSTDTFVVSGICKPLLIERMDRDSYFHAPTDRSSTSNTTTSIHGNIQYDFLHRSYIDTPFAQNNMNQHTIRTSVDVLVKGQYPVKIIASTRQSNSPYFRDVTDVSIQFNQRAYFEKMKNKALQELETRKRQLMLAPMNFMQIQINDRINELQNWLKSPARTEELIRERERIYSQRIGNEVDSNNQVPYNSQLNQATVRAGVSSRIKKVTDRRSELIDTLISKQDLFNQDSIAKVPAEKKIQNKRRELDLLLKTLDSLNKQLAKYKAIGRDSLDALKRQIAKMTDPKDLKEFVNAKGLHSVQQKGLAGLANSFKTIGLGRTWVDYSDLSVRNISVTGFNVEMNPGRLYIAAAAGKINYRFRDFTSQRPADNKQQLYLLRGGLGAKDGSHLYLTWYDGRKVVLTGTVDSVSSQKAQRVMGAVLEARINLNANNFFIAELGRSSFYDNGANQDAHLLMKKIWTLNDHLNEAFSLRTSNRFPQTSTSFTGVFRKMGQHFQSFNLLPMNIEQVSYQFKLKQYVLKNVLALELGVRKNDFSNQYLNAGLTSKTVFKSAEVTFRKAKLPFVSIGYYPTSQLTLENGNTLVENQCNTLSLIVNHSFRIHGINMSGNLVVLRFYNSSPDTGFIYYNAKSMSVTHFTFFKAFQLQTGVSRIEQRQLTIQTYEETCTWRPFEWITLAGGIKYSKVNSGAELWGGTGGLSVKIARIGTISGAYEKSFLPGNQRKLLPVQTGRVGYYKTF